MSDEDTEEKKGANSTDDDKDTPTGKLLIAYLLQFLKLKTTSIGRIMVIKEFPITNFNNISIGVFSFLTSVNLKTKYLIFRETFRAYGSLSSKIFRKQQYYLIFIKIPFCIYQIKIIWIKPHNSNYKKNDRQTRQFPANEDHYEVLSDFYPVDSVQLPVLENHH